MADGTTTIAVGPRRVYEVCEHTDRVTDPRGTAYHDLASANEAARKLAAERGMSAVDDHGDEMGAIYANPSVTHIVGVYARREG